MTIHELNQHIQSVLPNDCVRVQNQDVSAAGLSDSLIVCPSKPNVAIVLNQLYFRELITNRTNGIVNGVIINNDNFNANVLRSRPDAVQGLNQEFPDIVIDNDH